MQSAGFVQNGLFFILQESELVLDFLINKRHARLLKIEEILKMA
jgi:hypothetical protein